MMLLLNYKHQHGEEQHEQGGLHRVAKMPKAAQEEEAPLEAAKAVFVSSISSCRARRGASAKPR